ncbi:hypothetical protein Kpol_1070p33 [Vanderwaltozyma polyspora DSM 70294]|uniref:Chromatin structure-remodeling complex protein RSC8 n=1 Tax=Vanderwaltozyma polyspora (strain ATCC 22028 / DSM 70294 / BCRC 21397 / CBS 2163 / NBRC 10782 / NRRL Y-8283 / UCD 57-17) TaxID=436907 RepID=A7TNN3_VANPO|nr:uncharacterized protein Kpol_1070p33 [Vanderwaltozyma polyspora DSM 70294]EDO16150.1 hypothetical protein Kpol_1070p33 [Vanderwaltozyma polyspora DSM 70294]
MSSENQPADQSASLNPATSKESSVSASTGAPKPSTSASVSEPPLLPHLQQQQQQQDALKINYEEEAKKLEDKALRFLAKQSHPVVVPKFASWFDFNQIHEIEKKSLPDFFNDSSRFKTQKVYRDARNFMINSYRLSPFEYLTMTAVRRNIAMDVASINKIHEFLEKWGLINYQIDPRSKPSLVGPSFTGHFQLILDTPQGLKPNVPTKIMEPPAMKDDDEDDLDDEDVDMESNTDQYPHNLLLRKSVYDSTNDFNALSTREKISRQIEKTFICHTCGIDSVIVQYHNLRSRDANICSNCYEKGHFGSKFVDSDFMKVETNKRFLSANEWSDQEIVLLLEGLEMYADDWSKISEHVGTKAVEQCIEKYITLPMDEAKINEIISTKKNNRKTDINSSEEEVAKIVSATINSLLNQMDMIRSKEENSSSDKYIEETKIVVDELTKLAIAKLDSKFTKLRELEKKLQRSQEKYYKESEDLSNDRIMLSKQISHINDDLSKLAHNKKVVLVSDPNTQVKLIDTDEIIESNKLEQKIKETTVEPLSKSDAYKSLIL